MSINHEAVQNKVNTLKILNQLIKAVEADDIRVIDAEYDANRDDRDADIVGCNGTYPIWKGRPISHHNLKLVLGHNHGT